MPFTYNIAGPGGNMAQVTVPWAETEYRSILASSGSGFQIRDVLGGAISGAVEGLIGLIGGNHSTGPAPIAPTSQLPIPAPPGGSPVADVNIPGVGYFPGSGYLQCRTGIPCVNRSGRQVLGYYNKEGRLVCRKRPHMNVLNPRALKRSMRRVEGFAAFAKRTITFTKKVRMKKKGRRR